MAIYILCSDCIGTVLAPHIVYALNSPVFFCFFLVKFDAQTQRRENTDPLLVNKSFNLSGFDRVFGVKVETVTKHKGMPLTRVPVHYREP